MQFTPLKAAVAIAWLLVVSVLAAFSQVATITSWVTIFGFAVLPFVLLMRAWRQPAQSLSQSIRAETGK